MGDALEREDRSMIVYTLEEQFESFSKYMNQLIGESTSTNELMISLYQSDFWLRQANILDDRRLTMTETGTLFYKFG